MPILVSALVLVLAVQSTAAADSSSQTECGIGGYVFFPGYSTQGGLGTWPALGDWKATRELAKAQCDSMENCLGFTDTAELKGVLRPVQRWAWSGEGALGLRSGLGRPSRRTPGSAAELRWPRTGNRFAGLHRRG